MSLLYDFAVDSRTRLVASALALACLWPAVAGAQVDDPTITVCNDCSADFQYGRAAMQATNLFPGETKDVYVVNVSAMETMTFRISLITTVDPSGDLGIDISVVPIAGDPALMLDLADALQGIKDYHDAVIQDIPAEELDLPFDSALDLVGAGFGDANRIRLQQALSDRFAAAETTLLLVFEGLSNMVNGVIFGEAGFGDVGDGKVLITFPDGTTVEVEVDTVKDLSSSDGFLFNVDPDLESIRGPDGQFIPLQPGHLAGFDLTTSDADLNQALQELLQRLGAQLVFLGGGSSGGSCSTTCTYEDGVYVCTIVPC